jgi:hypothetical protein
VTLVQDPYNLQSYLAYNPFLPDINNELPAKNTTYKDNLASLERLVLFKFSKDLIVVPRESSWFGFYDGQQLVDLKDSDLFKVRHPKPIWFPQNPSGFPQKPFWVPAKTLLGPPKPFRVPQKPFWVPRLVLSSFVDFVFTFGGLEYGHGQGF